MSRGFFFWFGIVMVVVYIGLGLVLLFMPGINFLESRYQNMLGIVLILYALFRLISTFKKHRVE